MSTRGVIGFRIDHRDKLACNRSDSCPSWTGVKVMKFIRDFPLTEAKRRAQVLEPVDDEAFPTPDAGDLEGMLDLGAFEDYRRFMLDSLFCEWAWVVNYDAGVLEVYRGFQTKRHRRGRWCDRKMSAADQRLYPREYFPVALIAVIGFGVLVSCSDEEIDDLAEWLRAIVDEERDWVSAVGDAEALVAASQLIRDRED